VKLILIKEALQFAWSSLVTNRLRALLSLLGVFIGIFCVIAVFTAVDSLESNLKSDVASLGDNVIYIQQRPWAPEGGEYAWWKYIRRPQPDIEDLEKITPKMRNTDGMAYLTYSVENIEYFDASASNVIVQCVSHKYDQVRSLPITEGRYFSPFESAAGNNVCVIGYDVGRVLFGEVSPLGKDIKIRGQKAEVIGVMGKEGTSLMGNSMDNVVLLPAHYGQMLFNFNRMEGIIMVRSAEGMEVEALKEELRGAMRVVRGLNSREEDNFALNEASLLSEGMESVFNVISGVGFVIGGFSLLVGGFGIANIMFVSVRERTPLIGIQKALGAKQGFILLQYLAESVFLCIIGGAASLLLIFLLSLIVNSLMDGFTVTLSAKNITIGLIFSISIGVLAGVFPAFLASRLNPVDAIRANG